MAKVNFTILSVMDIDKNRQQVASLNDSNELVVSTRVKFDDNGTEKYLYEKGAVIVRGEYLENLEKFYKEILSKTKGEKK